MDNTPTPTSGRGPIRDFRDLVVWQRAIELAAAVHDLLRVTPLRLTRGLSAQLVRSAESVSANIAEGHGRPSRAEYLHFCGVANGSLTECRSHLYTLEFARGVRNGHTARAMDLAEQVARMLAPLMSRLREGVPDAPSHTGRVRRPRARRDAQGTGGGEEGAPRG